MGVKNDWGRVDTGPIGRSFHLTNKNFTLTESVFLGSKLLIFDDADLIACILAIL